MGQLTADLKAIYIYIKVIDVLRADANKFYPEHGMTKCRQYIVCSRVATLLSVTGKSMSKVKLNSATVDFSRISGEGQTLKSSLFRSLLTSV